MSRVTCHQSTSADGYAAGPNQTEERPFGDDGGDGWGNRLHAWMFDNPEENRAEIDQRTAARAYVMGLSMFGPVRGEWDRQWKGWWGDDPPFHAPAFVLAYPPSARPAADGRRHHVPLRHRRNRVGTGPGARGGRRRRCLHRGRREHHQSVSRRRPYRRAAAAHRAAHARRRHPAIRRCPAPESRADGFAAASSVTHVTYRVLS